MLRRSLYLVTTLLVLAGLLAVASPAFALPAPQSASGRVVAINRRTHVMVIRSALGLAMRLRYGLLTTRLWHNGTQIALSHLYVGNIVSAAYTPSNVAGVPGIAGSVRDSFGLYTITGTVAAVDTTLNTVSIASHADGSTVVVKVASTTLLLRDGKPATLADLSFGDQVQAMYDSATMIASAVRAEATMLRAEVEGSITAIDTTLNTVSISGRGDGVGASEGSFNPVTVTVNVASTTVVMLNGSPAPLSMLQVGMRAESQYDPSMMNANFVLAENVPAKP